MQDCAFPKQPVGRWGIGKRKQNEDYKTDEVSNKMLHLDTSEVEMMLNEFIFFKDEELPVSSTQLWWNKAPKEGGQCYVPYHQNTSFTSYDSFPYLSPFSLVYLVGLQMCYAEV